MAELVPLDELYKYEIWGRALAEGAGYRRLGELANWLSGLLNMLNLLNNFFYNTGKLMALHNPQKAEQIEIITYNLISPFSIVVANVRRAITKHIGAGVADTRMTIDEYFSMFGNAIYAMANDMLKREICPQCRLVTGQSCCWVPDSYNSPRLLINDMTAVFHRIIELYTKFSQEFGEVRRLSDKSTYSISASDIALQTLETWDKAIHTFNKMGIYDPQDYDALTGFAFDNMVELRVGSAAGHLTKIDLNHNHVDYYDNDVPVVDVLGRLFSYVGGGLNSYEHGHAVYHFPSNKYRETALIVSLATSMDFRVNDMFGDIWIRMFLKTIDYETYLLTKNFLYWHEEFENVKSIEDVRELDHKNFIELNLESPQFTWYAAPIVKQAATYAKEFPEAYHRLRSTLERVWSAADKAYWIMRERGVVEDAVKVGLVRGVHHIDEYLLRYVREHLPNYYQDIVDGILEYVALVHWYFLKAMVAFYWG